jgi:hypothetical protein
MPKWGWVFLTLLIAGVGFTAPAQGASMVFIKTNNVWMARVDGSSQVHVTRDGRRGSHYFSPSIADDGTIVALKSIFLHSFARAGRESSARASGRSTPHRISRLSRSTWT